MKKIKILSNTSPTHLFHSRIIRHPRFLKGFMFIGLMSLILAFSSGKNESMLTSVSPNASQTDIGTIHGKFSVNANGAANYNIPIKVPPGTAGMQPHLSLNYDSQNLNGDLGMGWSLEGLSVIERTGANINLDGFKGGVNFDENDRFMLDGERLINVDDDTAIGSGNPYFKDGATYHTERESWSKVVAMGGTIFTASNSNVKNPDSLIVYHKNGWISTYANPFYTFNDKKQKTGIRSWAISKIEDLNGNTMIFGYQDLDNNGYYVPQEIIYTSNPNSGLEAKRSIEFSYESRDDCIIASYGGYMTASLFRLKYIYTYVGGTSNENQVTRYKLDYENAKSSNRSILTEITECGYSQTEETFNCLTPTTFAWTGADNLSHTQTQSNIENSNGIKSSNDSEWIWEGDFNGDGMQDLLFANSNYNWYLMAGDDKGIGNSYPLSYTGNIINDDDLNWAWTGDMNGDGSTDLFFSNKSNSSEWSYLSITSTGVEITSWGQPNSALNDGSRVWISDINGDGISDLSWIPKGSTTDKLYFSLTSANGTQLNSAARYVPISYDICYKPDDWAWPGDYNGDGNQDLLFRTSKSGGDCTDWYIAFGSYQGLTNPVLIPDLPVYSDSSGIFAWPADMNGDGITDFFYLDNENSTTTNYSYFMFNKSEAGEVGQSLSWAGVGQFAANFPPVDYTWLADFNGDGLSDFFYHGGTGSVTPYVILTETATQNVYCWPLATLSQIEWSGAGIYSDDGKVQVEAWCMDVNGNGMSDFVNRGSGSPTQFYSNMGTMDFPDLMNKITDGLGGVIDINYAPITDSSVYTAGTSNNTNIESQGLFTNTVGYPYPGIPQVNNMFLVQDYSRDNLMGETYSYGYAYEHGVMNMLGWGSLGFETFIKTDNQTGQITKTSYNQTYPYNGKPVLIEVIAASNTTDSLTSAGDILYRHHFEYVTTNQNGYPLGSSTNPGSLYGAGTPITYQVALSKKWTDYYTYNTYDYSLGKKYSYDTYKNLTEKNILGYTDTSGEDLNPNDNVRTYYTFSNDTDKWVLGYKTSQVVLDPNQNYIPTIACGVPFSGSQNQYYNAMAFAYDDNMNILSKCMYDNINEIWLITQYKTDVYGNKTKVTDPALNITTITYDTEYHTFPDLMTSPANDNNVQLTQYFGYDPRFGTKLAHMDENGNIFLKSIDEYGRIQSKQGPMPTENGIEFSENNLAQSSITGSKSTDFKQAKVVTLEEYSWGKSSSIFHKTNKLQSWTKTGDSIKNRFYYTYLDGLGRPWLSVKQGPDNQNIATYTQFNSDNQKTDKSLPFFIENLIVSDANEVPFWNTTEYDIYKRAVKKTTPTGSDGSGFSISEIRFPTHKNKEVNYAVGTSDNYTQEFNYDFYNSKKKCTSMVVQDSSTVTFFAFDFLGRSTNVTDPIGSSISYTYDALGRLIKREGPEKGTNVIHYGVNGKKDWMTKDNVDCCNLIDSDTTKYTYDRLKRLTKELHYDKSSIVYSYDSISSTNGRGRLASVFTNTNGPDRPIYKQVETKYAYDKYGRSNVTNQIHDNGHPYIAQKTFDPLGRQTEYIYPNNNVLTLSYDPSGIYLDSISMESTQYASYSDYNVFDTPDSVFYGNGTNTKFELDPTGKINSQTIWASNDPQNPILDDTYTWDALNRSKLIDDMTFNQNGGSGNIDYSQAFTYEAPGRLITASGLYGQLSFGYDVGGNLIQKGDTIYSYSNHQVKTAKLANTNTHVFSAEYDNNGNMINQTTNGITTYYGYDYDNRLINYGDVEPSNNNFQLKYNHVGQMVWNNFNLQNTTFFEGMYELFYGNGYNQETCYIKGPYGLVASVTKGGSSLNTFVGVPKNGTVYFHQDYLQNTILTLDESGTKSKANRLVYDPFGGVYKMNDPNNFRPKFNGKEFISGSGLYYFNARFYNPSLGRFLTADTRLGGGALQPDSRNPYAFGLNNPVTYSDPTGHSAFSKFINHAVKDVTPRPIYKFAKTKVGKIVLSSIINAGEIAGGLGMDSIGLEEFGGDALLGAGLNGAAYEVTHINDFTWGGFAGAQLTGAMAGQLGETGYEAGGIEGSMIQGAATNVAGQFVSNAIDGDNLSHGLIDATRTGAIGGLFGAGMSEGASEMIPIPEIDEWSLLTKNIAKSTVNFGISVAQNTIW